MLNESKSDGNIDEWVLWYEGRWWEKGLIGLDGRDGEEDVEWVSTCWFRLIGFWKASWCKLLKLIGLKGWSTWIRTGITSPWIRISVSRLSRDTGDPNLPFCVHGGLSEHCSAHLVAHGWIVIRSTYSSTRGSNKHSFHHSERIRTITMPITVDYKGKLVLVTGGGRGIVSWQVKWRLNLHCFI